MSDGKSTTRRGLHYRLVVSRYDRVSGMLIALLILLGIVVLIMLSIWLTNQIWATQVAVPVVMKEIGDQEDDPWGPGHDIEPPAPQETDLEEEEMEDVIKAVADAMATRAAMIERGVSGEGKGKGGGGTGQGRKGARRRWNLRFQEGNTLETYARQLDFFGITLGLLEPDDKVLIISKLSQKRPERRLVSRDSMKKRYRFTWTQGSLEEADEELLERAGIAVRRRTIYKFLTPSLYRKLIIMEQERAGGKKVRSTRFGIKTAGSGYEFYIIGQTHF